MNGRHVGGMKYEQRVSLVRLGGVPENPGARMTLKLLTAELSVELAADAAGPPVEFRVLKAGLNRTKKGDLQFTARSQSAVLAEQADYATDYLIDYRHKAHAPVGLDPAQDGKAAGWCKLEVRNDELWAVSTTWSPTASKMLSDREYRYFSPVVSYDEKTLEVMELQSIALTNRPATKGLKPLMLEDETGTDETPPPPSPEPPRMKALLKQLGLDENATEGEAISKLVTSQLSQTQLLSLAGVSNLPEAVALVGAWKVAADALPTLQKKVAELEQATTNGKRDALIEKAITDGKATPAMGEWLKTLALEQVASFIEKAPVVAAADPKAKDVKEKDGGARSTALLSQAEKNVAEQMGLSDADMQKFVARHSSEA